MKNPKPARIGALLWLAAALLSACGAPAPASPSPAPSGTPAASLNPSVEVSVSPVPSTTATTTAGAAGAYQALQLYEDSLVAGQFQTAWNLLSSDGKAHWGSLAAFTKDRTTYVALAGNRYTIDISPRNTLSMSEWLVGVSWAAKIDQPNAYLFSVGWAGFGSDTTRVEIWIANPIFTGWELYPLN